MNTTQWQPAKGGLESVKPSGYLAIPCSSGVLYDLYVNERNGRKLLCWGDLKHCSEHVHNHAQNKES